LSFQVEEDPLEVGLVEELFAFGGPKEKGVATEIVDLASDPFGMVVQARDEGIREKGLLVAGQTEVMFDVSGGFLQVEGGQVIADGDALVKGLVGGKAEPLGQVGLTEEDEGQQRSGVHLLVEQEAELVEEIRREEMGLVDDEQDVAAFAGQVEEGDLELGEEAREGEGGFDLQGEEDLAVEGGDFEEGVGQINQGIEVAVEGVGKGADGGRFAAADVAGDEGGQPFLEGESQPSLDFLVAASGEEVLARDGAGERGVVEMIVLIEAAHLKSPVSVCGQGLGWTRR
jgi:hypothetical protein